MNKETLTLEGEMIEITLPVEQFFNINNYWERKEDPHGWADDEDEGE